MTRATKKSSDATRKAPKLALSAFERRSLRAAGIRASDVADLEPAELRRRVGGSIARTRCEEVVALADFQRLASIGLESARDLWLLGFRGVQDLAGQEPVELYDRLCRITRSRQDPCVEDVLRCAIAQAEDPNLPKALGAWWRWTSTRGMSRRARPDLGRR